MTRFAHAARGAQLPRIELLPEGDEHHDADAAVEFARAIGVTLDPWQEHVLRGSSRRRDNKWAAFEVGLVLPRQNGKNGVLEVRELVGLFVFGERLLVHTAHLADTAKEGFRRIDEILESNAWLSREVKHVWRANGHESVELKARPVISAAAGGLPAQRGSRPRLRFRTRTKGGGRGFSGDFVAFDEAMEFPEVSQQAILPVVSARPDPQVWYTGSAVDQLVHEHGRVLAAVRSRAVAGTDPSLAYFEWSLPFDTPDEVPPEVARDPEAWAASNPAFGIRITAPYVEKERSAFAGNTRAFAVERLGVGDWPALDEHGAVIDLGAWAALEDHGTIGDRHAFALDVSPDRAWASVAVAGARVDGLRQVEIVEHARGTGWVVPWFRQRPGARVVLNGRGAAGSLMPMLEQAGVSVIPVTSTEYARACGMFYDAATGATLRHLGDPLLAAAIAGARRKATGEAWTWSSSTAGPVISPLVAATLALWAVDGATVEPFVGAW